MPCELFQDLYELYALDALDSEAQAALAAHLARGCPRCAAAVAEARELAAQLALLAPGVAPPPRLRERILRTAQKDSRWIVQ